MMKLNKTFLTLGLAAALLQMPASSFAQNAGGSHQNPLLQKRVSHSELQISARFRRVIIFLLSKQPSRISVPTSRRL